MWWEQESFSEGYLHIDDLFTDLQQIHGWIDGFFPVDGLMDLRDGFFPVMGFKQYDNQFSEHAQAAFENSAKTYLLLQPG